MNATHNRTLVQTIVVDREPGRILLGLHKTGRWQGYYTGLLDEVRPGEQPQLAAFRIAREQAGIEVADCAHLATFRFVSPAWGVADEFEFLAESHSGQARESATLLPEWFAIEAIPYGQMPADDALWYPDFLERQRMRGAFNFAEDGKTLVSHTLEKLDSPPPT